MGREVRMVNKNWKHPKDSKDFEYIPTYEDEMPQVDATHYQMYETCTEGTPISPPMETKEGLARWLADNNASSFGSMRATYDQWLSMIDAGFAPSAVMVDGSIVSGVEAISKNKKDG